MQIKSYDIDRAEIVIGMAGADRRFAQAMAEIETAGGATATAVLTAQAHTGGNRYMEAVRPENVRILSGDIEKADIAEAINAGMDDTDPDRPEYELSYAAGEALGETETDAKMARERLKAGIPVRLRISATNGKDDLPRHTSRHDYYSREVARAKAIRTAKCAMDESDTDWSGWRVEAITNSGERLFKVSFEEARRK